MNKTIVILANSKKTGGRCLAGKELFREQNCREIGSWIRPVTTEDSGAVPEYAMAKALGHIPRLLEIIEIPLLKHAPLHDQPENWLLETPINSNAWRSQGRFDWSNITSLLDHPAELWNDSGSLRRVKAGYVERMRDPASLYLIKPDRVETIRVWSESTLEQPVKRRRRAILRYKELVHEFDIDDIDFENKHYSKFPGLNDPPIFPQLRKSEEVIVCVSLTPKFKDNNHYKIAAAFLEPLA